MSQEICLWSFKWSHLILNQEKYEHLLTKYPHTDDGFIHVVAWVVTDEAGRIYLHHNAKLNEFLLPWWKVERWETYEQALIRELKEELNIEILDYTHLSSVKYIAGWARRCFHMFQVKHYTGTPINNESDKFDQYWVEKRDSSNSLWFALNINGTITEDVQDIMHTFLHLYHLFSIVSLLSWDDLLQAPYLVYDESLIDISQHYYLYYNPIWKHYRIVL